MILIRRIKISTRKLTVTKAEKRLLEQQRKMPDDSPLLLILYLIGIIGLLSAVNEAVILPSGMFFLAAAAACIFSTVLWYIYIHRTKYFTTVVLIGCAVAVVYSLSNFREIGPAVNALLSGNPGTLPTSLLLLFSAMLILFIFTLEFVSRNHSLMFLICTAVIVLSPAGGIFLSPATVVMICIFQFGFYVMNTAHASPRKTLRMEKHSSITAVSTLVAAAVLLTAFLPSFIGEQLFEDDLYEGVYTADYYVQEAVNAISGITESGITDGTVSRGNLRQTGKQVFTAETISYPIQRLYLKAYVGDNFNGDFWDEAFLINEYTRSLHDKTITGEDDNEIAIYYREPFINRLILNAKNEYFNKIITEFDRVYHLTAENIFINEDNIIVISADNGYTYSFKTDGEPAYFKPSAAVSDDREEEKHPSLELPDYPSVLMDKSTSSDPIADIFAWNVDNLSYLNDFRGNTVHIIPEPDMEQGPLVPYGARNSSGAISNYGAPVVYSYSNPYKYVNGFTWAMEKPFLPDEINTQTQQEASSDEDTEKTDPLAAYESFISSYQNAIKTQYTQVPYETMPRLTELCGETNLTDLNEITTFILYTLQTHASYSTRPGAVPNNKNTVEYFLFDNHKGFCVHFATAAVMMYRMFGIPARYVSGFAVDQTMFNVIGSPSADQSQSGLEYHYRAEITDKNAHSWVEIFLDGYGWVPVEVTPTTAATMIAEYPGYDKAEMNRIMNQHDWHFNQSGTAEQNNNNGGGGDDLELSPWQILLIGLGTLLIVGAAVLLLRRRMILQKQPAMSCRRTFDRLVQALHCSGLLTGLNGSESHFAEVLSHALPEVTREDCDRLIEILQTDHYSPEPVSEEQRLFTAAFYQKAVPYLYEHTPWYRKPLFRFLKVLI